MATKALSIFTETSSILDDSRDGEKSDCGADVACLRLLGTPIRVSNGMHLHIQIHEEEIRNWPSLADEVVRPRMTRRKSPGELTWRIAISQSPMFGSFGRTLLKPYKKRFAPILTPKS